MDDCTANTTTGCTCSNATWMASTLMDAGKSAFFQALLLLGFSDSFTGAATCTVQAAANSSFSNSATSLTFLYQNNLNASDDINHAGALLLDPATQETGASWCASLGETLLPSSTLQAHADDFQHIFSYLAFSGVAEANQEYHVENGVLAVTEMAKGGHLDVSTSNNTQRHDLGRELPILCSQSSRSNGATNAEATASNELRISSTGNTYVGFRNQKSFRFVGIPYANPVRRWEHSAVFDRTGETIQATVYGPDCAQAGDAAAASGEDCLYLNIQTPYLPKKEGGSTGTDRGRLRPVMFSIHGGGFTGGSGGGSSGLDGGNMASREDIVSVQLNYRLSTLGFLAVPGTDIKGNYGIGDQITALKVSNQDARLCRTNQTG